MQDTPATREVLNDLADPLGNLRPELRHILEHALGPDRGVHRNHFVTGPGTTDYPLCEELVARGFMVKSQGYQLSGGDPIYRVTDFARKALLVEGVEEALAVVKLARQIIELPAEPDEIDWEVWPLLQTDLREALERFDRARKAHQAR